VALLHRRLHLLFPLLLLPQLGLLLLLPQLLVLRPRGQLCAC
jgi:hypothetical protein